MSTATTNIIYACKKCGSKGILAENVDTYKFSKLKNLPCGCSAHNGKFQFLHPR